MIQQLSQSLANLIVQIGDYLNKWLSEHLINIIIILVVAYISSKVLTVIGVKLLSKTLRPDMYPTETDRKKRLVTLVALIRTVVRIGVWTVAILTIASEMGINTGPLLASAGIVGLAISFGAQSLVKDFTTGIFIIGENQYRVGDLVEIAGVNGTVEQVGMRTTILRDLNGYVHHVPNGLIEVSTNKTVGYGRINEEVVVDFEADMDKVESIINHVGEELLSDDNYKKKIIEAPTFSSVKGYAVNGMRVGILGKTKPGDQWDVRTAMYKRLKKEFDKANIEITNIPVGVTASKPSKKI